ncbi:SDR family oxidoreductase [Lactobacillus corticis]|uniref:Sorbitol-6-phosphate 2-dehydrogenase n=1 Tax=Lactobacillus corticis TaxID=2201249 RepID=A0A916VJ90_9LACO|nr:SDR family oxidoreductase [Lactobacillus corticis]GFZ27419.1 sorbitol-6-phosphate 2-dehydrogenase [Lactobacillus corticis]
MSDWLGISGRTYVVTGGSSGIGNSIVKELLENGANIINADLNPSKITNERLLSVKCDVTSEEDVNAAVAAGKAKFGKIDGLVNNAGINLPRILVDQKQPDSKYQFKLSEFQKMFSVNVQSVFLMTQAVVKELVKNSGGVVVNMSSEAGLEGSQGQSIYSATKGAINGLTRSWAKELGKSHVRVVGVAPEIMEATGLRTPAYEEALAYTRNITVDQLREGYKSTTTTPMGRSGKLSEVADLVNYLLSDRASYITGVTINVAGGKSRG